MTGAEMQSRFARDLERRYADHRDRLVADGVDPELAHKAALKDAKGFGRAVLEYLSVRSLFPWKGDDPVPAGLSAPRGAGGE